MNKKYHLSENQIRPLVPGRGSCIASDLIVVEGQPVGYMYRESPDSEHDSGWRFFSGQESQEYTDDPAHFALYDVNTIANYSTAIIPLLDRPVGSAFERDDAGAMVEVAFPDDSDDDSETTPEPLLVSDLCEQSGRSAIVSEEGDSVWLYLTVPESGAIERDCWLFNTPQAVGERDLQWYRERSLPPPAPPDLVRPGGVREPGSIHGWSFRWSSQGDAVLALADGEPFGFVVLALPRGLSRFLLGSSDWGDAWDAAVVERRLAAPADFGGTKAT